MTATASLLTLATLMLQSFSNGNLRLFSSVPSKIELPTATKTSFLNIAKKWRNAREKNEMLCFGRRSNVWPNVSSMDLKLLL